MLFWILHFCEAHVRFLYKTNIELSVKLKNRTNLQFSEFVFFNSTDQHFVKISLFSENHVYFPNTSINSFNKILKYFIHFQKLVYLAVLTFKFPSVPLSFHLFFRMLSCAQWTIRFKRITNYRFKSDIQLCCLEEMMIEDDWTAGGIIEKDVFISDANIDDKETIDVGFISSLLNTSPPFKTQGTD